MTLTVHDSGDTAASNVPKSSVRAADSTRLAIIVGALGVVFGDIGTSPIYTMQTVFNPADPHPVPLSDDSIYGVASLIFWSVMLIVTLTYVTLVMRADNNGEGGIMALITLIRRHTNQRGRRVTVVLSALGIFGAALFFGDSMITPAISVLSAVEGLKVVAPGMEAWIVPITLVIIAGLFAVQHRGTAFVARFFGPVMLVWFVAIGLCGAVGIAGNPAILRALSPTFAISFAVNHFDIAFFALSAIVLAVTGAEALYADMGHFGRRAITRGWLLLVLPSCTLSYLGQGALLLEDKSAISAPFFLLGPDWVRIPIVVLATAATVIASQAVITGAFSVASQAAQLGYLPRLRITHTSAAERGQVYVPFVNGVLMIAVLALVATFQSSAALAYAFGMAVITTISITTLLFLYHARTRWRIPLAVLIIGGSALVAFDVTLLLANLTKLLHGAWLPLLIGVVTYVVMMTWQRGRSRVTEAREQIEGPLGEYIDALRRRDPAVHRVPGTAVFLNRGKETAPLSMLATVAHTGVLHEHVIIVSVDVDTVPRVPDHDRVRVDHLHDREDGIVHVSLRYGYMERPDVPAALEMLGVDETEGPIHLDEASYFLSKVDLSIGSTPSMGRWRKRLFLATSHITADAAGHFNLPLERTVIIGSRIEV
jgi:KUP system potassium uptake protein